MCEGGSGSVCEGGSGSVGDDRCKATSQNTITAEDEGGECVSGDGDEGVSECGEDGACMATKTCKYCPAMVAGTNLSGAKDRQARRRCFLWEEERNVWGE